MEKGAAKKTHKMNKSSSDKDISSEDDGSVLRGPLILGKIIADSIQKKCEGQPSDYDAIVQQISAPDIKPVMMGRWLKGLRVCVSHFTKECDTLVGAAFNLPWACQESRLVDDYISYITDLMSAQTSYLKSCLHMLVKHFHKISDDYVYFNVHQCLKMVCELVPNTPGVLMPILAELFPFKSRPSSNQEIYVRNLFIIIDYIPNLRDAILHLIVNQMIKIDHWISILPWCLASQVEVPHLEEEEEEYSDSSDNDTPNNTGEIFHCETESSSNNSGNSMLSPYHYPTQQMANDMADKLDVMMLVVYEYLHKITHTNSNGTCNKEVLMELLHVLVNIFESCILSTYQSSHVQFLLFQLSSHDLTLQQVFLDYLWNKFRNVNVPVILRQSSVAYMASYIARALFVPTSTAKLSLSAVTKWMHDYINSCSPDKLKPEYCLHAPFYSACQASFYMFIFRHQELLELEYGLEFLQHLNFERIVLCPLNPLKMCFVSVAEIFASITNQLELAYCYTILEQNKRLLLLAAQTTEPLASGTDSVISSHPLDTFFPFDPYLLRRSSKFIKPLYRHWKSQKDDELGAPGEEETSPVTPSSLHSFSMQSSPGFGLTPDNSNVLVQQK